jgi:hypothetical protein
MTIFDRYQLNFDTTRFGDAQDLSSNASNTINLIANNSGAIQPWQQNCIASGAVVRSDYFQNPTTANISSMLVSTANIAINSLAIANSNTIFANVFSYADNLIVSLNSFQSHTDNICGLNIVSDATVPSYDTAFVLGQMSMFNLAKCDEPQTNTSIMLGCFTSLFIPDILKSNTIQLEYYNTELSNSIVITTDEFGNTIYYSTLSASQISNLENYLISTASVLDTRRSEDWTFYQNSLQIAKDVAFMQQFSSMGGTQSYLVNNIIGTPALTANLTSNTA